ncbi:MAG: hypothetical protein ACK4UU_08230 [Fimbriimonadales bacterium]|jgi:hypothetical protein|nr:hypothetical protein [Rhodospirillaceae bacterium]
MTVRSPILRYQIRYRGGGEPESLIASDIADAMTQASQRAKTVGQPVALWRDGRWIADVDAAQASPSADLIAKLVHAGIYVFGAPFQDP